ncbi:hypothetical protein TIFTF001_004491 [Ficus carica]|uniref:Legume lectin domain-containing protein n=1 Tax=Ficus carica TaxID=3494 RepID=A0AA88CXZ5_FICCA|nr:hypothetical protein TIFTF001_004491 [Ficus carica]
MSSYFHYKILKLPSLLFIFPNFPPSVSSIPFNISHFEPDEHDVVYHGDAMPSQGNIELNMKFRYLSQVGWATYAKRVPIWNSETGNLTDFTTRFSFTFVTTIQEFYGHGLAFFLAPVGFEIPPYSAGGFLGLFNTTTSSSSGNRIVLVEFDFFGNPEWDPSFPHIGINNGTIESDVFTSWNASGTKTYVLITYNASTKNLSVSWNYGTSIPSISRENGTSLS